MLYRTYSLRERRVSVTDMWTSLACWTQARTENMGEQIKKRKEHGEKSHVIESCCVMRVRNGQRRLTFGCKHCLAQAIDRTLV